MRIVSLLPSATEIAYALGLGDDVRGVTFECDFPQQARAESSIVVGGLHTEGLSPGAIDDLVRAEVAAGNVLYTLDAERLRECAPDVILTQDLCRVCALPSASVDQALESIGCSADVVTLDPHTLEQVLESIGAVAAATGATVAGADLVSSLRQRLDAIARSVEGRPTQRVFVLEWSDPPFVSGHWVPDLVVAAGGQPILCSPGARSHPAEWAEIRASDADVVIVAPCGFGTDGAEAQAQEILDRLPAGADVWAVDANSYIVRPGPRLVEGVELVAAILHPELFAPASGDRARRVR